MEAHKNTKREKHQKGVNDPLQRTERKTCNSDAVQNFANASSFEVFANFANAAWCIAFLISGKYDQS